MRVLLAAVRRAGGEAGLALSFASAAKVYLERMQRYEPAEFADYASEAALLAAVEKLRARTAPVVALLDSRGQGLSSEELARWMGRQREGGAQNLVFAVGPADGWSAETLARAKAEARAGTGLLLSLGAMTLPHELARVVLAEQVYRALSILAGHPYHRGSGT
jgi:23S rRNA (pseudouridine1915-N3)-methyltransferase